MSFSPSAYRLGSGLADVLGAENGEEVASLLRYANEHPNEVIAYLNGLDRSANFRQKRIDRKKGRDRFL